MQALTFEIRLLEPVLAGQAQSGEENSNVAFNFIPGSIIRGSLIGRYQQASGSALDAADEEAQALFFNGLVRYLNSYPLHPRQNIRMLPTPLSWHGEKDILNDKGAPLWDFSRTTPPDADESYKVVPDSFCWWPTNGESVQFVTPTMQQLAHNYSRDRNRKEAEKSGVFRYEALAPGQHLAAAIIAPDGEDGAAWLQRLRPLLAGRHHLGGSQTGGYGAVEIENVLLDPHWQEYEPTKSADTNGKLIVTLLSDAILRKADSGEMVDSLHQWLEEIPEPQKGPVSFHRLRRVGGFNRKWGLPLPQAWAIQAGSVFLFDNTEQTRTRLARLVAAGIGERQAEGFGRIALQWTPEETFTRADIEPRPMSRATISLSTSSKELVQQMVQRRLESELDEWLNQEVAARAGQLRLNGLRATQLSRARLAARHSWHEGTLNPLQSFFKRMTKRTRQEWRKARIDRQLLLDWIDVQLESSATMQPIATANLPQIGEVRAEWRNDLRARTTARLIEGVLRRAVRHAKSDQEGEKEA